MAAMITHKPKLELFMATTEDVRAITSVWYTVFSIPFILKMFPDTPTVRKWWDDHNQIDMENKPAAKYLIVKDVSQEGNGKVVGYAKWWVPIGKERLKVEERFPEWSEEGDRKLLDKFFGLMAEERKYLMGDKQYYYLDMLGTIPEYRRLGVANMLVKWGVDLADRDKLECFVDASDEGRPVYNKFGFLPEEPFMIDGEGFTCTSYSRPPKK